jgi:predicted NBD/HSP70 family sugar kinase
VQGPTPENKIDGSTIRQRNLSRVLGQSRNADGITRAEIASNTGLTRGAVGSLVSELEKRGLLKVGMAHRNGDVGRPGNRVKLVPNRVIGLGLSITTYYIHAIAMDLSGAVLLSHMRPINSRQPSPEMVCAMISSLAEEALENPVISSPDSLLGGIGIAVPGLLDLPTGIVRRMIGFGWQDVALGETLQDLLPQGITGVRLDSAAGLGAFAEHRSIEPTLQHFIYVAGAASIEAGFIIDGVPFRGSRGYAGEIGHMVVETSSAQCKCGRIGCWEAEVGLDALLARVASDGDPVLDSTLDIDYRATMILERAHQGDQRTRSALEEVGTLLGIGLANLVNAFNPEALVVSGYLSKLSEFLLPPIQHQLDERAVASKGGGCRLITAYHGTDSAVVGAALAPLSLVLEDPTLVPSYDAV